MNFWFVYLGFSLVAAGFLIWPTVFFTKKHKQQLRASAHAESNELVYQDHLRELEQTMIRGEINAQELNDLRRDLEKTMIEDGSGEELERPIISSFKSRIPILSLILVLPIATLALYSHIGAKKDWEIYSLATSRVEAKSREELVPMTEALVMALQDRVKEKPGNAQNWFLLATTSAEMGNYDEAVRAFKQVLDIQPQAPAVKAELAQALFLRAGNTVTPEVRKHTQEALALAPNMPTALGLAGIDAYQLGNYNEAIEYWQKALVQLNPSSAAAQALTGGIARANDALESAGEESSKSKPGPQLDVKVAVEKGVQVKENDTVFVYARAWQGPKMPLAIQKTSVSELPATIRLDNNMAMSPGMTLASFPQVELVARISSSGSAVPQPGDWEASYGPVIVANQNKPVELTISTQIPNQ